eukprot:821525-Rhodomonas_salina.1
MGAAAYDDSSHLIQHARAPTAFLLMCGWQNSTTGATSGSDSTDTHRVTDRRKLIQGDQRERYGVAVSLPPPAARRGRQCNQQARTTACIHVDHQDPARAELLSLRSELLLVFPNRAHPAVLMARNFSAGATQDEKQAEKLAEKQRQEEEKERLKAEKAQKKLEEKAAKAEYRGSNCWRLMYTLYHDRN